MQASEIQERAKALDDARRIRIVKPDQVDFEKYLKANDLGQKIRDAENFIEEMRADLINPETKVCQTMPWTKTHVGFQFRPGEVTVYAGGNGGGETKITGQSAPGRVEEKQKGLSASFGM